MNKQVIFRLVCGIVLMIESIELGRSLTIRDLCYKAENKGKGTITFRDIHGKDHIAVIEAIK